MTLQVLRLVPRQHNEPGDAAALQGQNGPLKQGQAAHHRQGARGRGYARPVEESRGGQDQGAVNGSAVHVTFLSLRAQRSNLSVLAIKSSRLLRRTNRSSQ